MTMFDATGISLSRMLGSGHGKPSCGANLTVAQGGKAMIGSAWTPMTSMPQSKLRRRSLVVGAEACRLSGREGDPWPIGSRRPRIGGRL